MSSSVPINLPRILHFSHSSFPNWLILYSSVLLWFISRFLSASLSGILLWMKSILRFSVDAHAISSTYWGLISKQMFFAGWCTLMLTVLTGKIEVCPVYNSHVGECLLEKTLVLGHRLCEGGWPFPFLAAFISPVFPPGPHLLLGGQWACILPLARAGS